MRCHPSSRFTRCLIGAVAVAGMTGSGLAVAGTQATAAPVAARHAAPETSSPSTTTAVATVTYPRYRTYALVNRASGLRADVMWASQAAYTGVFLWPFNSSGSQRFRLLSNADGSFRIQAVHSGQCLMLDWRSGYSNGTKVIQYPYCGNAYTPSQWYTRRIYAYRYGPSKMLIVNKRTGRCLDTENPALGTPGVRAVLQQWQCASSYGDVKMGNQAWNLVATR